MAEITHCEYCGRQIKGQPEIRVLRGKKHVLCSDFCFRLFFYEVPTITFEALQEMYRLRCVSVKAPDFRTLVYKED